MGEKNDLVDEIKSHLTWYENYSDFYAKLYNGLSVVSVICSTLTAVLAAWSPEANKIYIVALPLLAGAVTTVMSQWNIKETWQLRVMGRIAVSRLLAEAWNLPESDLQFGAAALRIRLALSDIEAEQARGFFSAGTKPSDKQKELAPA